MYYGMTDNGIHQARNLVDLNRKMKTLVEENEMQQLGPDKVVKLTEQDLEFLQDKKRMSRIPIEKLFKKNNTTPLILGMILLLQIILIFKK